MNLDVTAIILQTALLLLLAPLVSGVIRKGKARLQNRRGPPVWQPYLDLRKFLRKDMVIPNTPPGFSRLHLMSCSSPRCWPG